MVSVRKGFYKVYHSTEQSHMHMKINEDPTHPSSQTLPYIYIYIYIYIYYMVLFTNPSARAGYDTRSIFKRSLTGLNSEFSFS